MQYAEGRYYNVYIEYKFGLLLCKVSSIAVQYNVHIGKDRIERVVDCIYYTVGTHNVHTQVQIIQVSWML